MPVEGRWHRGHPPQARRPLDCSDGQVLHDWCLAGYGIAWRSTWEVEAEIAAGRLAGGAGTTLPPPPNGIHVVFPQRKHMPLRVRLWIEHLKHQYAQPAFWKGAGRRLMAHRGRPHNTPCPPRPRSSSLTTTPVPRRRAACAAGRLPQFRTLEAASAALGQALQDHPEVELVLLDLSMPGARGFRPCCMCAANTPSCPWSSSRPTTTPRHPPRPAVWCGGLHPKSAPADAMGDAIQAVLDGGSWFPPMAAERAEADAELAARLAQLTPQQFRVLLCLADGLLNKQIAADAGPGRKHREGACHRHSEKTGVLQPHAGGGAGESLEAEGWAGVTGLFDKNRLLRLPDMRQQLGKRSRDGFQRCKRLRSFALPVIGSPPHTQEPWR